MKRYQTYRLTEGSEETKGLAADTKATASKGKITEELAPEAGPLACGAMLRAQLKRCPDQGLNIKADPGELVANHASYSTVFTKSDGSAFQVSYGNPGHPMVKRLLGKRFGHGRRRHRKLANNITHLNLHNRAGEGVFGPSAKGAERRCDDGARISTFRVHPYKYERSFPSQATSKKPQVCKTERAISDQHRAGKQQRRRSF